MIARRLKQGDEEKVEDFLSRHTETSMFLRSNMRNSGLEYEDKAYHGEYFGVFDDAENTIGVLAHYWNGSIHVQAINESILDPLIKCFLTSISRPVSGVLGVDTLARVVIEKLSLADEVYSINSEESLYALNLEEWLLPESCDGSHLRMVLAAEIDRAILTRWIRAYEMEALGLDESEALDRHTENRVNRFVSKGDCWALLMGDQAVSLSGFNARLPDVVQLGPVWTPPEYRNRGHARTLVALTLEKAKQQGVKKAILFTDNPAAAKAYKSVGFGKIGTYRLAMLKEPVALKSHGKVTSFQ